MKIALMCSPSLDEFQQRVLVPILEDNTIEIVEALIDCSPKQSVKNRFLKNLKRGRGGYMLVMLAKSSFAKQKPSVNAKRFLSSQGINCVETTAPYADDNIQQLRLLHPKAMVMLGGFGIVKEPLLSMAPEGILSYHHGNMRKYRGQPVGFWELYNGEHEMGITVQRLAAGIDKGIPIVEKSIDILPNDTVNTLCQRALECSTDMMHQAIINVQQPDFRPEHIEKYGPVFTLPNLRQYIFLHIKLLLRR